MEDGWHRQIFIGDHVHASPFKASLAPTSEIQKPPHLYLMPKCTDAGQVRRHREVGVVPTEHGGQEPTLFVDRLMPDTLQFCGKLVEQVLLAFAFRLPPKLKAGGVPLESTDMRES